MVNVFVAERFIPFSSNRLPLVWAPNQCSSVHRFESVVSLVEPNGWSSSHLHFGSIYREKIVGKKRDGHI